MNGMSHPLQQYIPQQMQQQPGFGGMSFQNPLQQMMCMMEAMRNPVAFIKQNIPGIPDQNLSNPSLVLQYMQQNLGVTDQDIQRVSQMMPRY